MDAEAYYADVVERTATYLNPNLSRLMAFAGFGVEMRAEGCYIYDQEDRAFLDCLGGYGTFSLGHRHPKVIEAVSKQLHLMPLSAKSFFSANGARLAEKLAQITPENIQFSFFCNSGTEAVEAALKFAKGATGRSKVVSTHGSYHGKTLGALSVTGREKYRKKFEPLLPGVQFVDFGNLDQALLAIDDSTAAFIVEPVQGEGGINVAPKGYLKAIKERCQKVGALLIADEVQCGLARTGKMFGCDHEPVAPDMITLAKSLGGGVMPIGAMCGTAEVWERVYGENPLIHTSTFGGNPMACAAGLAAIETLEEEGLVERSEVMGAKMKAMFEDVQKRHPDMLSEVRGIGLMIGTEFSMDEVGELVVAQLIKRGVCVAYALNNPRVLRWEPPLIITETQIEFAVEAFESAVAETSELLSALV